jgi:hypothetical protein
VLAMKFASHLYSGSSSVLTRTFRSLRDAGRRHAPPEDTMPERGHELMRGLMGMNIIDIDITTMTPLHNAGGATPIFAVSLLAESLVTLR